MTPEWTRLKGIAKTFLPIVALFLILLLFVWPTAAGIVNRWFKFDEAYSHGLLLLVVSVFLIARSVKLKPVTPGFYPLWLIPFALALAAYALGELMRVQALSELTIVPLLLGAAAILLGWGQVRQFIIPIGILFFAVPVWDFTSWPLQIATVEVNRILLGLFGIDFRVEGVFVYLTDVGIFEVANGCSGLRYLLVGQSIALMFGELNLRRLTSRIWIFLTALCLALLANWIRVFVIIYVGHETNMQSNLINEHDDFGWWVFAGTLVPLFIIGRSLEKGEARAAVPEQDFNTKSEVIINEGANRRLLSATTSVLALVALAWFAVPAATTDSHNAVIMKHNVALAAEEHWLPLFTANLAGWGPVMERPDRLMENSYIGRGALSASGESSESLFLGLYSYDSQRAGHEVVHYNNRLYDPSHYLVERVFNVELIDREPMSGMTLRQRGSEELIHLAFAYYVEGRWEDNEIKAKLAQLPGIFNGRTDASLLVIGLQCDQCNPQERLSEISPSIHSKAERYLDQLYSTE